MSIKLVVGKLKKTGFFHVFSASMFNYVISFFGSFVLVRILSKDAYGLYGYVWNLYSFFALFSGLGMVSGVLQLCSESRSVTGAASIFLYAIKNAIKVNVVLSVVIFLFSYIHVLPLFGANDLLAMVAFFPLITIVFELFLSFIRAQLHARMYSYLSGLSVTLNVFFSVLFAYYWSTAGFFVGKYIAGGLLVSVVVILYKVRFACKSTELPDCCKKKMWSLSFLSMLNNALSAMLPIIEILVIGYVIRDSESVAMYKVATLIPFALLTLSSAFVTYIYPYFAKNRLNYVWVREYYKKSLVLLGILYFFVCAFFIVFGKKIIMICFGEEYIGSYIMYCILLIGTYFQGTFVTLTGNVIVTQQKLRFNLLSDIVSFFVCALATFFLVSEMKILGAAVAHVITILISSCMSVLYMHILLKNTKG